MPPSGMLVALGLRNGDVVTAIDGRPITAIDQVMSVYTELAGRANRSCDVSVVRAGASMTFTYTITD